MCKSGFNCNYFPTFHWYHAIICCQLSSIINFHLYNTKFYNEKLNFFLRNMNEKLKKSLHIMDEKPILNENLKKCLQNMDERHPFARRTVGS